MPGQDGTIREKRKALNRIAAKRSREMRRFDEEASCLIIETLTQALCYLTQSVIEVQQSDSPLDALEELVSTLPSKDDLNQIK